MEGPASDVTRGRLAGDRLHVLQRNMILAQSS